MCLIDHAVIEKGLCKESLAVAGRIVEMLIADDAELCRSVAPVQILPCAHDVEIFRH